MLSTILGHKTSAADLKATVEAAAGHAALRRYIFSLRLSVSLASGESFEFHVHHHLLTVVSL